MKMDLPNPTNFYKVTSVTLANSKEPNWYHYTISNNTSTITGQRRGTFTQVNQHAEDYSRQLNERLRYNVGNYKSTYQKKK